LISEGSCDNEDWSNDAENSALPYTSILKYIQIEDVLNCLKYAHKYGPPKKTVVYMF